MRTVHTAAVALSLCLAEISPALGTPVDDSAETVVRDVEIAFRDAMEMWAYREFWHLWEVSTEASRFHYSQNDFAALMEKGSARPAAGRRVEDVRISVTSPQTAVVLARIGLEDPNTNTTRPIVRSFLFSYEGGRWHPQLSDFPGLSAYTFPWQPPPGTAVLVAPCRTLCVVPPPLAKTAPPGRGMTGKP